MVACFRQRAVRILALFRHTDLWDVLERYHETRESCVTEHPKAAWFRRQALECVTCAQRAKDARIKRLHALEAMRWLRLAELKPRPTESDSGLIAAE
jgi:hypothetical protein